MPLRIRKLIPGKFRAQAIRTALAVPLRAILDLAGLAVLIPLLALLLEGGAAEADNIFGKLYRWSGIDSYDTFVIITAAVILLFLVVKNLVSLALARHQTRFLLSLYGFYSARMFSDYYRRGLLYIKGRNITDLEHEINYVCYSFAMNVLAPLTAVAGEVIFMLLLFTALAIYAPLVALLLPVCFLPVVLIYIYSVRRKLARYGKQENVFKRGQSRLVREIFSGYAEMEVAGALPSELEKFRSGIEKISAYRSRTDTLLRIPAGLMETGVAAGIVLLAVTGISRPDSGLLLGIFAVSALKLLPSVRTVMNGWAQYRSNRYTVDVISACDKAEAELSEPLREVVFSNNIEVSAVEFGYGGPDKVIRGLDLTILKGETVGISGPSGIGKTTLFNILLGLYPPEKGVVLVDGEAITEKNRRGWLRSVGYVPQDVFIKDASLADNIALGSAEPDRQKIMSALEQASLDKWVSTLPEGLDTILGERGSRVSGGERQRIGIARALYRDVSVLLLDEATSSVDSLTEQQLTDSLNRIRVQREGLTILLIAHRESTLAICDRIIELK